MELCTGFEPVILVLQTSALTNLANRAFEIGAHSQTRTEDLRITSASFYQLN